MVSMDAQVPNKIIKWNDYYKSPDYIWKALELGYGTWGAGKVWFLDLNGCYECLSPQIHYTTTFIRIYLKYTNIGYFLKPWQRAYTLSRWEMDNVKRFYSIK